MKNGIPVKTQSSDDYLSIADELRNLPIGTRNPISKLDCRCRICQIARSRFPFAKRSKTVDVASSATHVETVKRCPKCMSLIGQGHKHSTDSCQSSSTVLDNLEKQLPSHVQEQFASRVIDKAAKNSKGQSVLHTTGRPKLVSQGPLSEEPVQIPHDTFFRIEREVGLSANQINNVKTILTADTKRSLVQPHLKQALIDQRKVCDDYFHVVEKFPLLGKEDLEITRPVVLCKNIPGFISFVKEHRTETDFIQPQTNLFCSNQPKKLLSKKRKKKEMGLSQLRVSE